MTELNPFRNERWWQIKKELMHCPGRDYELDMHDPLLVELACKRIAELDGILLEIHKANDTTCVMCGAAVCTVDGCRGYRTSCRTSTETSCPGHLGDVWLCGDACIHSWFALSVQGRIEQWRTWEARVNADV